MRSSVLRSVCLPAVPGAVSASFGRAPAGELKQDVGRLDVTVDDAGLMNGGQAIGHGVDQQHEALPVARRAARLGLEARRQGAAIRIIHHEIRPPVIEPPDIMNGDDVGRADAPQQTRFLDEASLDFLIVGQLAVQHLERDERLQLLVPGLDHDGKPAAGYFLADLIAADIGRQCHSQDDRLQGAADVHAVENLHVEDIVVAVGGTDA